MMYMLSVMKLITLLMLLQLQPDDDGPSGTKVISGMLLLSLVLTNELVLLDGLIVISIDCKSDSYWQMKENFMEI